MSLYRYVVASSPSLERKLVRIPQQFFSFLFLFEVKRAKPTTFNIGKFLNTD